MVPFACLEINFCPWGETYENSYHPVRRTTQAKLSHKNQLVPVVKLFNVYVCRIKGIFQIKRRVTI